MINTGDLQAFLEKIQGGTIPVDLLKIGQAHHSQHANSASKTKYSSNHHGKFHIALDIEDCLDRFYGGYYSDWACGGQWNRAYQFVRLLIDAFSASHIEVVVFFDGTLKENKNTAPERMDIRQKTVSVLKHIRMIGTPPPKIWWLPPSGLRTCLRNALRTLNVAVVQTVHDHSMEVIDYFHEYKLDGILGLNPDYVIANTTKYYSSHDLRLSYKGALETKEYLVSKILSALSLTPDHLPFMAVFLGGYILIDDAMLKDIYKTINVEYAAGDFEARIRRIAEIIRNSPTNDPDEFIRHLSLEKWEKEIKESIEYFKRTARLSTSKKFFSKKRTGPTEVQRINDNTPTPPMASEMNETDEIARKMLQNVNSLVDDESNQPPPANDLPTADDAQKSNGGAIKKAAPFVYALPGEVLKTSLNRHQQGIMDPRIYQLITKKEIFLPQILEDEQYREPSIHLFYRPARQMIYAILFNLYHQKYLCDKKSFGSADVSGKDAKNTQHSNRTPFVPEVLISEWSWSPKNEYKKAEQVAAQQLPWAVPTIRRLWFGMAFEDKTRRMKAFLTVMRSDTPLMLNRNYVPQHMLALACVLRYIITSPDRKILTRLELDAFLATAFSQDLNNVDYTQELVLPGVNLRGVYLATLFMQGVETASLANDACGVPLPWVMTNAALFFDGKLFHFKLKMSTYVPTLRDLCDNQIDTVIKVDRFRKAILEDIEHLLMTTPIEQLYRAGFVQSASIPQTYSKSVIHPIASIPQLNGSSAFYNQVVQNQMQYNTLPTRNASIQRYNKQQQHQNSQQQMVGGYQLKVGGVVVGSWAGSTPNRANSSHLHARLNRAAIAAAQDSALGQQIMRYPLNSRNRMQINTRVQRNTNGHNPAISLGKTISRNTFANNKVNRNRNRNRNRKNDRKTSNDDADDATGKANELAPIAEHDQVVESENSSTAANQAELAKSMCHDILKEDDDTAPLAENTDESSNTEDVDEQNGNIEGKLANLSLADTTSDVAKTVNGNSENDKTTANKSNKKSKAKKRANVVNNNGDNGKSTENNRDSYDNNADDNGHPDESDNDKLGPDHEIITDDSTLVHQN